MKDKKWRAISAIAGSLRAKVILLMLAITLVPMLLTEAFIYFILEDNIDRQYAETSQQYLDSLIYAIDESVGELDKILLSIFADSRIQQALNLPEGTDLPAVTGNEIDKFLATLSISRRDIDAIYVLSDNLCFYTAWTMDRSFFRTSDWYIETIKNEGTLNIIGLAYPLSKSRDDGNRVISVARAIRDHKTHAVLGVARLDINFRGIQKICEASASDQTFIRIVNPDGVIIYATNPSDIALTLDERIRSGIALSAKGSFSTDLQGTSYVINYSLSEYTGWTVMQYTPGSMVNSVSNTLAVFIACSAAATCVIALAISVIASKIYCGRIYKMRDSINVISAGNFDERIPLHGRDELNQLAEGINTMAGSLSDTLARLSEINVKQKEMELRMLINQINPHFLFNSLNSIKMLAVIHEQSDIASMTEALGRYYQLTISNGDKLTLLRDEIEHTELYLQIQRFRFTPKFDYRISLEERIRHHTVMKLILQPIVENAIVHGIENSAKPGWIHIDAWEQDNTLWITVEDNGTGFDAHELSVKKPGGRKGIGIDNVDERLKLMFGPEYGLIIESRIGVGTKISIKHPVLSQAK